MEEIEIGVDGTIRYYKDNKLHRVDGPAVVRLQSCMLRKQTEYHLNGIEYTKEEHLFYGKIMERNNETKK